MMRNVYIGAWKYQWVGGEMQQWYQCPSCGTPVAFGVSFCGNCGTQLNWPAQQQPQHPPVYQQPQQQWGYGHGQAKAKQQKTSSWLIVSIALIVVVLLVGGGVFAFNAISGKTPPPSSPPITPPATSPPPDSPPTADVTAPTITNTAASPTETSAVITWTTNEPATSQVEYGKTAGYGSASILNQALVISHSITLSSLEPNITYHFRVKSRDNAENESVSEDYTFATSKTATEVGGILSINTVWSEENSPYRVTSTVQIPSGVTLTIEPGVTVTKDSEGDMFLLNGTISARGTNSKKVILDGGNKSNFFGAKNSTAETFLDLDYCVIKDGRSFWPPTGHEQYGHFSLTHCELTNLTSYSYIWYPGRDVHIEYNQFTNTGGFSIGHRDNVKVYIRYNLFNGKNSSLPSYTNYWIQNWASYDSSETVVKYNSFINTQGAALELPGGYDAAAMTASENYWGTQDTSVIDKMIYDKNDDITSAGYINYLPILTESYPSTPQTD
jgi:cytoskeletal protein RodZ